MDTSELVVVLAGVVAVAWVNWYFFLAGRRAAAEARVGATGLQQAVIRVQGGYAPARIRLRAGQPARLVFDRREEDPCSEEVVIPDFRIRSFLPAHQRTSIDLPPARPGTYAFSCGMGMLRGSLLFEEVRS